MGVAFGIIGVLSKTRGVDLDDVVECLGEQIRFQNRQVIRIA